MIQFRCSSCHSELSGPDHLAGSNSRCPLCGQVTRVPYNSFGPLAALWAKAEIEDDLELASMSDRELAEAVEIG